MCSFDSSPHLCLSQTRIAPVTREPEVSRSTQQHPAFSWPLAVSFGVRVRMTGALLYDSTRARACAQGIRDPLPRATPIGTRYAGARSGLTRRWNPNDTLPDCSPRSCEIGPERADGQKTGSSRQEQDGQWPAACK